MMKLPVGNKLRLLTDASGLDRTIRWTHYVEKPEYLKFLRGGELVLTTALLLQTAERMVGFIQALDAKGCAGMVLSTDTPLGELSYMNRAVEAANALRFAVFLLPWEIGMVELCQVICKEIVEREMSKNSRESFMDYLLSGDIPPGRTSSNNKNVKAAKAFGYAEGETYAGVVVDAGAFAAPGAPSVSSPETHKLEAFADEIYRKAKEAGCNSLLHVVRENKIILMVSRPQGAFSVSRLMAKAVAEAPSKQTVLSVSVGIGPPWTDLSQFKRSVQIAGDLAAKANGCVVDFSELDLDRLLYGRNASKSDIEEIAHFIFAPLNEQGENRDLELKRTLKAYIKNMCNLAETAKELFIHINTLRYKIRKIEELCGGNIKNPETYFRFCLGFKLEEFVRSSFASEAKL
jgi:hypothetical protein